MTTTEEVGQALNDLIARRNGITVIEGVVKDVNTTEYTCDIETEPDVLYLDCRLRSMADTSTSSIDILPKQGAYVVALRLTADSFLVLSCSEIEDFVLKSAQTTFNTGSNGGLMKVIETVQKINALENLVNNLLATLQTIVVPLAPSGTYPFAPMFAAYSPLTPTLRSDVENTQVKH